MRYSQGKWIASYKDTWSVDNTLNKIVLAHIQRLYDCLSKSECCGVPMHYVHLQGAMDGLTDTYEGDVDKAHLLRMKDLEELLWVFGTQEPAIEDYAFSIEMIKGEKNDSGHVPVTFITTGEDEKERYWKDMEVYTERKKAGYKLFGEIYEFLEN